MKSFQKSLWFIAGLGVLSAEHSFAQTYQIEAEHLAATGGTYDGFEVYENLNFSNLHGANYIQTGDWGEYSLKVNQTGYYTVRAVLGTPMADARLKAYIDGSEIADIPVPKNGEWDAAQTVIIADDVLIKKGEHVFKVEGAGNGWEWNADYFEFTFHRPAGDDDPDAPKEIEAENWVNTGGTHDGFEVLIGEKFSGGAAVDYVQTGDWADYAYTALREGFYKVEAVVATPLSNSRMKAYINGTEYANVSIPSTGEWDKFKTVTVVEKLHLKSGDQILRFEGAGEDWEWNADKFIVTFVAPMDDNTPLPGQGVAVQANLDVNHIVGLYHSFDRTRFITMHATHVENDWEGNNAQSRFEPNELPDLRADLLDGRDVYLGRDTGNMAWQLSQAPEDPARKGWADADALAEKGGGQRWIYSETEDMEKARAYEWRNTRLIVGGQQRPYWPDGESATGQGWFFSQTDTEAEPLGTSVGHFMGKYVNEFFRSPGSDDLGQLKPKFVEIMNEPLFDLVEYPHGHTPAKELDIFKFHNAVANEIRKQDSEVFIGGYTVAFPNYEVNNFEEWETTDKQFMNIAGWNMDFISIHLYDFPNIPYSANDKREQYRKGSNMEATMDMLEGYMDSVWNNRLPIVVSEYGSQLQGSFGQPWSAERDWLQNKAFSAMLLQFLERPDRIEQAVPFIPLKAEWGRISETVPYYWRLMIQAKERPDGVGDHWVYSDLIYFYDLWKNVSGKRIDTWSADPDIQVDAYVNGDTVYFIANNLEFNDKKLALDFLGENNNKIKEVHIRQLYQNDSGASQLDEFDFGKRLPNSYTLKTEATMVAVVKYEKAVEIPHTSKESKYYAKSMTQDIKANTPLTFKVKGVDKGTKGEAVLRLGVGRAFGLSLQPTVKVNGHTVEVPTDFRGYDQYHKGKGRDSFFGVLEIPVPYKYLRKDNEITVNFRDSGGKVSTVAIQNFKHSKTIPRAVD